MLAKWGEAFNFTYVPSEVELFELSKLIPGWENTLTSSSPHDDSILPSWIAPWPGESEIVAAFVPGNVCIESKLFTGGALVDYAEVVKQAVISLDISNDNSIIEFLRTYGGFSSEFSFWDIRGLSNLEEIGRGIYSPLYEIFQNGLFEIEPLWLATRDLALFKVIATLMDNVIKNQGRALRDLCDVFPPDRASESKEQYDPQRDDYLIQFVVDDIPDPVLDPIANLTAYNLPFEPNKPAHFTLAAWQIIRMNVERVLSEKLSAHPTPQIPWAVLKSIPSDAKAPYLRELKNEGKSRSYWNTGPGLFKVRYDVLSNEALAYLSLLSRAMSPPIEKQCPVCNEFFVPESGKFKYCCNHSESDIKRWRRHLAKKATGQPMPKRGRPRK